MADPQRETAIPQPNHPDNVLTAMAKLFILNDLLCIQRSDVATRFYTPSRK